MAAFLSGEMKDTVQMNPAGVYGQDRSVSNLGYSDYTPKYSSTFSREKSGRGYSAAGQGVPACGSR